VSLQRFRIGRPVCGRATFWGRFSLFIGPLVTTLPDLLNSQKKRKMGEPMFPQNIKLGADNDVAK
jgi:hypothetical protein